MPARKEQGAERFVLLGDFVGYGADPEWVTTTVMELVGAGAMAVMGNHDDAVGNPKVQLNAEAQAAMEWTRGELGAGAAAISRQAADEAKSSTAGSTCMRRPVVPASWTYVTDASVTPRAACRRPSRMSPSAATSTGRRCIRCRSTGKMTSFVPTSGVPVQLLPGRRWLVVVGSVGQPRDGNPAAAYAHARHRRRAKSPIAACPTTSRRPPRASARMACRSRSPTGCW